MCWLINKLSGYGYFSNIMGDVIFQRTNVMFTCNQKSYDVYDIYALWCSGVNIFNVDRTTHDENYFNNIKDSIIEAESLYTPNNYRPIGLSITMSINAPVNIDERVDVLILKNVIDQDNLREFKKQYLKRFMPILLFYSEPHVEKEEIGRLIQFSDGLVMDIKTEYGSIDEFWYRPLLLCKEHHKSVFYLEEDIIRAYNGNQMGIITLASELVKCRVDGIVLVDCELPKTPATDLVRAVVTSMRFVEDGIQSDRDYSMLSLKLKSPVLPYISISLAACIAALTCGASAIMVLTVTGRSARWISCTAPPCPVLAITTRESTARRMHLYRRVMPLLYDRPRASNWQEECRNRVTFGTDFALTTALFNIGAKLVVLAPSVEGTGYCNSFYMITVPFNCAE